uniref:Uncharacterized protein n=1 Tax=Arundo donax TaxID=35708 RepID=A0A0A9C628_ARUDO
MIPNKMQTIKNDLKFETTLQYQCIVHCCSKTYWRH